MKADEWFQPIAQSHVQHSHILRSKSGNARIVPGEPSVIRCKYFILSTLLFLQYAENGNNAQNEQICLLRNCSESREKR